MHPMKKTSSHVLRGVAGIFLALLVIFGTVSSVANSWAGKVNELLGVDQATITRSNDPADYRYQSDYATASDLIQAEIDLNTRLAAEGSVALKGQPALGGTKVTLFGMRSGAKMQFGGSMGELIEASNVVTLGEAMEANGFSVNPTMLQFYKDMEANYAPTRSSGGNVVNSYEGQGAAIGEVPVSEYSAASLEGYKDAAVIVLGRDAGESACFYPGLNGLSNPAEFTNSPTGNILSLSNEERELVNWVKGQGFGKIVVLLNSSTAMEIDELKRDAAVDSIVWIGNPGAYGTYGIAKLLSGEALPSGHLPDTFAVNTALSPAAQNYGIYVFSNAAEIDESSNHALRSDWYLAELEGIYTGYKYYETRYFDSVLGQGNAASAPAGQSTTAGKWDYDSEVSYSFGYGLEGSTFTEEIEAIGIDWSGETDSSVRIKVTNTGTVAAKHVVQLYVSVPYTQGGVEKSAIQLVGYAKTGEASEQSFCDAVLLQPGESESVTITFNAQDFYSYDMRYSHDGEMGAWVLDPGSYVFATGNGAHDAVNAVLLEQHPELAGQITATGAARTETLGDAMAITESNGATVKNQLDEADLNAWNAGVSVSYLSRSDWAGSFPKSVDSITATPEMIKLLRNATYDQSAELTAYTGPSSFTYGADNGLKAIDLQGLDYDDPAFEQVLEQMSLQDLVNQYIAYLEEIEEIAMPIENRADSPLGFIGTIGQRTSGTIYAMNGDEEGFKHGTYVYVGGPVVAATFSPALQKAEGELLGNDSLWTGYDTWFGPGMNLHRTPYNGRNVAYYSEDAVLTGLTGAYVHQGLNEYGVVTNVKHFAFNDQETNRDGLALFLSEQAARENELRGFQIGVRDGDIKGMMSAFNRIGLTHVAAHRGLMNGILRGEWGWNGFMMTDSVKSTGYFLTRETAMAGNDQMLGGSNNAKAWNMSAEEVEKDIVFQNAIRESYHRKLFVYVNSNLMNGITSDSASSGAVVWWVLALRIAMGLSLVGFAVYGVRFLVADRKERRQ